VVGGAVVGGAVVGGAVVAGAVVAGAVVAGADVVGSVLVAGDVVVVGLAQMPSAVAVRASTTPVTGNPLARWKLRTAVTVTEP
jgi:hypothetical protein